jgi:alpha-L-rhamnosidase
MYGDIRSHWQIADVRLVVEIQIPANTKATVRLPQATLADIREGQTDGAVVDHFATSQDDSTAVIEVGSGSYRFEYPWAG